MGRTSRLELVRPVVEKVLTDTGWGDSEGARLLDALEGFLQRFVSYPTKASCSAHALWIVHTHAMDAWDSTPRIAFLSPEPSSGKTRALEVTEVLVPNPVEAVNVTAPYLFRKVGAADGSRPTVLHDEIDTVFGPKAGDNEEVRGLLNAGHRQGATAGRCVVKGNTITTEEIPAYCAVALAGLGNLPDTILARSVIINMRPRTSGEKVKPWRRRLYAEEHIGNEVDTWPEMPEGIEDRDADVWEALLVVADKAGGRWPRKARAAAQELVAQAKDRSASLGVQLLDNLREVFGTSDAMQTEAILATLNNKQEWPWGDLRGKPLDGHKLAKLLRRYDIKPKQIRFGEATAKGYPREAFEDSWARYLPDASPETIEETRNISPL